jgi:putative spermidine/putrescine transport system ATP-binding protein
VFVTHDQEEALSISDRIVVLNAGNVEQFGQPFDIYNRPATRFVATFVGQLNTLNATVTDAGAKTVKIGDTSITVPALPDTARTGEAVSLTMRPEAVSLAGDRDIQLDGRVAEVHFLGSVIRLKVDLGGNTLSLDTFNDQRTPPPPHGAPIRIGIASSDVLVLSD